MSAQEEIKKELGALIDNHGSLSALLDKLDSVRILAFGTAYQAWYTRAIALLRSLAPDRLDEFVGYYRVDPKRKVVHAGTYVIQDYINGYGPPTDHHGLKPFDEKNLTALRLYNQVQILKSLQSRIDSVVSDVQGALLAELEDWELDAAEKLKSVNLRAAGALAGVVLERHLQRVAEAHGVVIKKKDPTIADLNDPLKQQSIYGIALWRKIQYLADVRNLCAHKKNEEATKEQVGELIAGVNVIVKTVH